MALPTADGFTLRLSDEQRELIQIRVRALLEDGLSAKSTQDSEVDYFWMLYEQARTRSGSAAPWPNAADLTSHIGTEAVDSIHARLMSAVWSDPICTVEGYGTAADRAPYVEEFHQWKAEEERLQSVLDRLALISLVEPRGLLEIAEGTETRTSRREMSAKLALNDLGGITYDLDNQPTLERTPTGELVEAQSGEPSARIITDETKKVRVGPIYRILPYRDSVILPTTARDEQDIFAYGKRFHKRLADLRAQAKAGIYDTGAVDRIGATDERDGTATSGDNTVAIELWELLIQLDLVDLCNMYDVPPPRDPALRGARWYLVTLHLGTSQMLRIQHDHFERSRFVLVNLHPRADRVTEGYSLIGHKLITTIEEHTAWRNMAADRAAMSVQAPLKVVQGALWNPVEQPFGPSQIIHVRDPREVEAFVIPDVTAPALTHIQMQEHTAQRLSGVNDIASGQVATENRTLGEIKMATAQSFVRIDLMVRRFQEAVEDLFQIRHLIWKRVLAEQPEGIAAPQSLVAGLEGRGVSIDQYLPNGNIMGALLDGAFRFKPHGSVETADIDRLRNNFVGALQGLGPLLTAFPMLVPRFQTPQAAYAMGRQFLRVFRVPNTQAFLGSPMQDALAGTGMGMVQSPLGAMMGGLGPGPSLPPGLAGPPTMAPPMPGANLPGIPAPGAMMPPTG